MSGDPSRAAAALEASLGLDPGLAVARCSLAVARVVQRKPEEARRLLGEIAADDAYAAPAARLLERLGGPR